MSPQNLEALKDIQTLNRNKMNRKNEWLIKNLREIIFRVDERKSSTITLALNEYLINWERASVEELTEFESRWLLFSKQIILVPEFFFFVFREVANNDSDIFDAIKVQHYQQQLSVLTHQESVDLEWVQFQCDASNRDTMLHQIIKILQQKNFDEGKPFEVFSSYFSFIDLMYSHLINPDLISLHHSIFSLLYQQTLNWSPSYCDGYAYQGLAEIGVSGIKPTEIRLGNYNIDSLIHANDKILDIGSNNGFLAIYFSRKCEQVDALEYNPYLCQLGRATADYLDLKNVNFICDDFYLFSAKQKYNAIFSLANHATIDCKLSINFEEYLQKIYCMLESDGYLFFESHDVFGNGTGNPGDDGDLDLKLDIAAKYFEVIDYKMTAKFVPCDDIDKLFIVFKRKPDIDLESKRSFSREQAVSSYHYERSLS